MKYNPALAYRALSWLRAEFSCSPEAVLWEGALNVVGAIVNMFRCLNITVA